MGAADFAGAGDVGFAGAGRLVVGLGAGAGLPPAIALNLEPRRVLIDRRELSSALGTLLPSDLRVMSDHKAKIVSFAQTWNLA